MKQPAEYVMIVRVLSYTKEPLKKSIGLSAGLSGCISKVPLRSECWLPSQEAQRKAREVDRLIQRFPKAYSGEGRMAEELVDFICRRVSFPRLDTPAPSEKELQAVYRSALRAPDHKMLKPWRYLIVSGPAREKLGEVFCKARERDGMELSSVERAKFMNMPMRAPMIIIGISKNIEHEKVPEPEQEISCGVGMGYMLLSLQALGYGGMWRTGSLARHPEVKAQLGIAEHEAIVGFLYVGTPQGEAKPLPNDDIDHFFKVWS